MCHIEAPHLPIDSALATLDALGQRAAEAVTRTDGSVRARLGAINHLLYDVEGFRGNHGRYDDIRNSLLTVVLERRLGIPVTLAVIYMTIGWAAGIEVLGVAFPGHFLMRVPRDAGDDHEAPLILDPFDKGRELDRAALDTLLARHMGERAQLDAGLLTPCTSRHIIVRMLNNMKRLYVGSRSFRQAWQVADLLVTLDGRRPEDLRDRGLIAYHLDEFPNALVDLEAYLSMDDGPRHENEERRQIWDHVEALRRRVATMN